MSCSYAASWMSCTSNRHEQRVKGYESASLRLAKWLGNAKQNKHEGGQPGGYQRNNMGKHDGTVAGRKRRRRRSVRKDSKRKVGRLTPRDMTVRAMGGAGRRFSKVRR